MTYLEPKIVHALKKAQRRCLLTWSLRAAAFALPLTTALLLAGLFAMGVTCLLGVLVFGVLLLFSLVSQASRWPTLERLINHMDRSLPEMEDSSALLLKKGGQAPSYPRPGKGGQAPSYPPATQPGKGGQAPSYPATQPGKGGLAPLQQLQRARLLDRLHAMDLVASLPSGGIRQSRASLFRGAGLAILMLASYPFVPRDLAWQGVARFRDVLTGGSQMATAAVAVGHWQIKVQPPEYTGLPDYKLSQPKLKVAQGAQIEWQIKLSEPVLDLIVHHRPGESLRLGSGSEFRWRYLAGQPGYYYLELQNKRGTQLSTYFPLEILPDQAPVLTLIQPEATRTEIGEGSRKSFDVQLQASDDYGLAGGHLVVTLAKGSGENVKFRERTWPLLGWDKGTARNRDLHALLDFVQWEIDWGDELYFHVELWDNRLPEPNRTRSDTFFLVFLGGDRPQALATEGILIRPVRAYFRSQRQLIIDTEKLLAQTDQISESEFRRRSESLGVEQKVLRLRYGQFLGEEFEAAIGPGLERPGTHDHEHASGKGDIDPHHQGEGITNDDHAGVPEGLPGHDHEDEATRGFEQTTLVIENVQDLLPEGILHDHDNAETATFFDPEIKRKLKDALSEMWQSELFLRTIEPKSSLPYQYRALKMIKEIQHMSRVYEQRVGIETPPLQPEEKRLTGERKNMASLGSRSQLEKEDPNQNLRLAWQMLESNGSVMDQRLLNAVLPMLEKAARARPDQYLPALEALNRLQIEADSCGDCRDILRAGLWHLLPSSSPEPQVREEIARPLADAYLSTLGTRQ